MLQGNNNKDNDQPARREDEEITQSLPAGSSTIDHDDQTQTTMDVDDGAMETDDNIYETLRECDVSWEAGEIYTRLMGGWILAVHEHII